MANTYEQIKTLASKNNMGLSNTINRDYGIPLDNSSVYENYEAAIEYAKNSTLAYIGQPISVGDTLYIVTEEEHGYLKAVGTVPEGDDVSITITEDGNISLAGFIAAENATLPRKSANGTLEWVTIDAIVAGDGNEKTRLKTSEGSAITVSTEYDEVNNIYTYTLDVDIPAPQAVPEYSVIKEIDANNTIYKISKDGVAVGEPIVIPEAYDDTSVISRITELENTDYVDDVVYNTTSKKIYLVSNGVQLGEGFDATAFIKDGMIESVELKDNKLIITWNSYVDIDNNSEKDITELSLTDLIDVYSAGTGIKVTGKTIAVDENIVATVSALNEVQALAQAGQTSTQVNTAIQTALGPYAKTSDIELAYATTEMLNETNSIATDAQSRVAIVEGKIRDITSVGGEPNVLEKIKVNGVTQQVVDREVALTIPIKIADLSDGNSIQTTVTQNTASIETLDTSVSNISINVSEISNKVAAAETTIAEHTVSLNALVSNDAELLVAIQANENNFSKYSTTEQVNAKIDEKIAAIDLSIYTTDSDVAAITDPLDERISDIEESINTNSDSTASQLENITARLAVIEGSDIGSIKKAIVEANSYTEQAKSNAIDTAKDYTDTEVLKDRTRIGILETNYSVHDSTISSNTVAINNEVSDRINAIAAINEKLGDGYSKDLTIKADIVAAKQAGIDAANTLANGAVATNTSNIVQIRTDLNNEIAARENADNTLSNRVTKVEAFFDGAAEDSEGLNNALDKLVDIQNFLSGEGSTVDQLFATVDSHDKQLDSLESTVGDSSKGLVKAMSTAELSIQSIVNRTSAVEKVISGYTADGEIKSAVNAAQSKANEGVTAASAAQKTADDLASVVAIVEQVLETTKNTADAAGELSEANATEIANVKASAVSFTEKYILAGEDIIIFNCGTSTENI